MLFRAGFKRAYVVFPLTSRVVAIWLVCFFIRCGIFGKPGIGSCSRKLFQSQGELFDLLQIGSPSS